MDPEPPVIRIVKKKGHGGHHGGAWKVAYADFVTAMMAFFLVMWIVGLSKPVRQAIAAYFKDPVGFMKLARGGKNPLAKSADSAINRGKPSPLLPTGGPQETNADRSATEAKFKAIAQQILEKLQKSPDFKGLKDSIQVHLTDEGLRIELMEKTPSLFFSSGSAALHARTVRLLRMIAGQLGKLNNPIVMEGDTDSHPYTGRPGYSNWELSVDRANAARRVMEGHGIRKGQVIEVRGYADHKLLDPKHPYSYVNRRVSILVAYTGKGQ